MSSEWMYQEVTIHVSLGDLRMKRVISPQERALNSDHTLLVGEIVRDMYDALNKVDIERAEQRKRDARRT